GLAGGDVTPIDQLHLALADVTELLRILEAQRLPCRDGLAGGGLGERSVPGAPTRRTMNDLVVLRLHLADGHFPAFSRGGFQHGARCRAAAAHGLEEMSRAPRAVGVLVAELLLVTRRLRDAHALPVGLELV